MAYRVRRLLRSEWRSVAASIGAVALATFVVVALAAGAERTTTAPSRYAAASGPGGAGVVIQPGGEPRTDEIASLPGVAGIDSLTFFFGALSRDGGSLPAGPATLAGSFRQSGRRLVRGRAPDPARSGEFVASRSFFDADRAFIGESFDLVTLSPEQSGSEGFGSETPAGPSLKAVLVGEIDGPSALDDPSPGAVFSAATLDTKAMGISTTLMTVHPRSGVTLDEIRDEIDGLADSGTLSLEPFEPVSGAVRTAVDGQARALWLFAGSAGLGVVAVLAPLISRQVRLSVEERLRLMSIGLSDRQITVEAVARAAVPVLAGVLLGGLLAPLASPVFPTGFVRNVEPAPGLRVETGVVLLAGAALITAMLGWSAVGLLIRRRRPRRPSVVLERMAAHGTSTTAAVGLHLAFARTARDRGSVRSAMIGLAATVAIVAGAITFGVSLDRLVDEPANFGANFDLLYDVGSDQLPAPARQVMEADPDIAAVTVIGTGQARVGAATLRLISIEPLRGALTPHLLAGRLPEGSDEIALGRLAAKSFGVGPGDQLTLDGASGSHVLHVAGLVVVPSIGINDGVGQDGVVTPAAMAQLDPTAATGAAIVKLRPDAPPGTIARLAQSMGIDAPPSGPASGSLPPAIVNVARIRSIPALLAALFGVLAALTVVHAMSIAIRNRRRDLAVLRALGAGRGWLTHVVHWQATLIALLPGFVGLPLGVFAGRLVFRVFADSIGTVDDAAAPLLLTAAVGAALLVFANLAAIVPARRATRLRPAAVLQAE